MNRVFSIAFKTGKKCKAPHFPFKVAPVDSDKDQ